MLSANFPSLPEYREKKRETERLLSVPPPRTIAHSEHHGNTCKPVRGRDHGIPWTHPGSLVSTILLFNSGKQPSGNHAEAPRHDFPCVLIMFHCTVP
jgi:hypothetical protein